jgi:hypothetical protein
LRCKLQLAQTKLGCTVNGNLQGATKVEGENMYETGLIVWLSNWGILQSFFLPILLSSRGKDTKNPAHPVMALPFYYGKFKTVLAGSRFSAPAKVRVSGLVGLSGAKLDPRPNLTKLKVG